MWSWSRDTAETQSQTRGTSDRAIHARVVCYKTAHGAIRGLPPLLSLTLSLSLSRSLSLYPWQRMLSAAFLADDWPPFWSFRWWIFSAGQKTFAGRTSVTTLRR